MKTQNLKTQSFSQIVLTGLKKHLSCLGLKLMPNFTGVRAIPFWRIGFSAVRNKRRSNFRSRTLLMESLAARYLNAADLVGTSFDSPESLRVGEPFGVHGTLWNSGDATAQSSHAYIYASPDAVISSSDTYIGQVSVPSIRAGRSFSFSNVQVQIPSSFAPTGSIYIGMIVDATNRVSEGSSGELNNRNQGTGRDRDAVQLAASVISDSNDQISEAIQLGVLRASPGATARWDRGEIENEQDVDMFAVTVVAGQEVGIDIDRLDSRFDSYMFLFDSNGRALARSDDTASPGEVRTVDSYIQHTFSQAGTFYIGISGYGNSSYDAVQGTGDQNGSQGLYRLELVTLSGAAPADSDSNDQIMEAGHGNYLGRLGGPGVTSGGLVRFEGGVIESPTDVDMFAVDIAAGQRIGFNIDRTDGRFDSYLRIFDEHGRQLASNDDGVAPGESAHNLESYVEHTFQTAGRYYIGVSGFGNSSYNAQSGNDDSNGSTGRYNITAQVSMVAPLERLYRNGYYGYAQRVQGGVYSQAGGYYSPGVDPRIRNHSVNDGNQEIHNGVDFAPLDLQNPMATAVVAPESGTITTSRTDHHVGYLVILRGDSGIEHILAHLDSADGSVIRQDSRVSAGQYLGRLAPPNRVSENPNAMRISHLHYGTRLNNRYFDPAVLFPALNW